MALNDGLLAFVSLSLLYIIEYEPFLNINRGMYALIVKFLPNLQIEKF